MASRTFLPDRDATLLAWSVNFNTKLTATPTAFGMTAGQATNYASTHTAFATALATATNPSTRTKEAINVKDTARKALKLLAGAYGKMIDVNPIVTDAQRIALGLNVRAQPAPIPAPSSAPALEIVSVTNSTVKIKLHDTAPGSTRGKPAGVAGASVFSYIGATAPTDVSEWTFEGSVSKTNKIDIQFDSSLAPGTKVWLCAFWYSGRALSGPACDPVGTNLQGGGVSMAA